MSDMVFPDGTRIGICGERGLEREIALDCETGELAEGVPRGTWLFLYMPERELGTLRIPARATLFKIPGHGEGAYAPSDDEIRDDFYR